MSNRLQERGIRLITLNLNLSKVITLNLHKLILKIANKIMIYMNPKIKIEVFQLQCHRLWVHLYLIKINNLMPMTNLLPLSRFQNNNQLFQISLGEVSLLL